MAKLAFISIIIWGVVFCLLEPACALQATCPTSASEAAQLKQRPSYFALLFTAGYGKETRACLESMERAVSRYNNDVRLVKASVDDPLNEGLIQAVGVEEVPTVILVARNGQRVKTLVGLSECLSLSTVMDALLPTDVSLAPAASISGRPEIAFVKQDPKADRSGSESAP